MILILLGSVFGFFMAWGIGANDVANAMGTSVGSKALTITQALIVAAIFESAGAILVGGQVTDTIRSQVVIVPPGQAESLVYGMMAALLAAGTWLCVASFFGWPVSTTHSIVGALIGFAWFEFGREAVHWREVLDIFASWIVTPLIAGFIAYWLFVSEVRLIFYSKNPISNAKRYVPVYIFLTVFVIAMVTLTKGLKHLHWTLDIFHSMAYSTLIALICALYGVVAMKRLALCENSQELSHKLAQVERIFAVLMIFTACAMAFAHGSNDVANAIGPVAAIIAVVHTGSVEATGKVPVWVLVFGAIGIVTGLAMYGHKVIATVGNNITELTPSRGFAASLATASTVVVASGTGLPVSTTQTLVGAILGIGVARGFYSLNLKVIQSVFMSWLITLPAGAFLAILFFSIIKLLSGL